MIKLTVEEKEYEFPSLSYEFSEDRFEVLVAFECIARKRKGFFYSLMNTSKEEMMSFIGTLFVCEEHGVLPIDGTEETINAELRFFLPVVSMQAVAVVVPKGKKPPGGFDPLRN